MNKLTSSVAKGYLIYQRNWNTYDQIVTFLLNDNTIITMKALGANKIASKNRNSLQYGKLLEIEYFKALESSRLSKLKKVVTIGEVQINHWSSLLPLYLLNALIYYNHESIPHLYEFYNDGIVYLQMGINPDFLATYFLIKFEKLLNPNLIPECFICHQNQNLTFNFHKHNFYCLNCNPYNGLKLNENELNFIKLILNKNDELSLETMANNNYYPIDYQALFSKLYEAWKKKLWKSH